MREEETDSLNNRFKPDPLITTEAIFSLDDDTLIWCSDLERGFEEWKKHQNALVGYFPRLLIPPGGMKSFKGAHTLSQGAAAAEYLGEAVAFQRNTFNAVLTVGMFYHVRLMDAYWSPEYEKERTIVDDVFNCEDILMNYVSIAAAASLQSGSGGGGEEENITLTAAAAPRFVRPRRRLDLALLVGGGISGSAAHAEKRAQCVAEFRRQFQGLQLPINHFNWTEQPGGRPLCSVPGLGCIYL